jgi:hypothetical protein
MSPRGSSPRHRHQRPIPFLPESLRNPVEETHSHVRTLGIRGGAPQWAHAGGRHRRARISGCANQELSLDDQVDHATEVVAEVYDRGPVDYRVVATKGKGERLDRPELAKMEAMLRTRELDLLVFEG